MNAQEDNSFDFIKEFKFYMNNSVDNQYAALRWHGTTWDRVVLFKIDKNNITNTVIGGKYGEERSEISRFVFFETPDVSLGATWKEIDFNVHFADFRKEDLIEKMQEALVEKQK